VGRLKLLRQRQSENEEERQPSINSRRCREIRGASPGERQRVHNKKLGSKTRRRGKGGNMRNRNSVDRIGLRERKSGRKSGSEKKGGILLSWDGQLALKNKLSSWLLHRVTAVINEEKKKVQRPLIRLLR